jgi:branched-chain amino acid transport system permease protein
MSLSTQVLKLANQSLSQGRNYRILKTYGVDKMFQQLIINTLIAASTYALVALGFTIIYKTGHLLHFAHGIVFTAGAYFLYLLWRVLCLPCVLSIGLVIVLCVFLGCLMEVIVYKRLRLRGASPLIFLIASIGMYVAIQNGISLTFTDETLSVRSGTTTEGLNVFGARITPIQLLIVTVVPVLIAGIGVFLRRAKLGIAMRIVASDLELAIVSGIESNRIILAAFALGSGLAGIAGMLVALDLDLTPVMGMRAIMMALVVVMIGGIGSIRGLVLGAIFLGFAQQLAAYWVGMQWQDAIAFVILLVFLIVRPQGFIGRKVISSSV